MPREDKSLTICQ